MNALLNRMSVAAKIALPPAFALVCLCLVAAVVQFSMGRTQAAFSQLERVRFPAYEMAMRVQSEIDTVNAMVLQSLAWDAGGFKASIVEELDKRTAQRVKSVRAFIAEQTTNAALDEATQAEMKALLTNFDKFAEGVAGAMDLKVAGLSAAAGAMKTSEVSFLAMKEQLHKVVGAQRTATSEDFAASLALANQTRLVLLSLLGLAVVLAGGATWMTVRTINQPLHQAVDVANAVAHGDLTAHVEFAARDATGEMLSALNAVTGSLSSMVGKIRESANTIDHASQEIAQGNNDLSQRTEQQAADLQQTAASVEQLTATVKTTAGNAHQAKTLSQGATQVVQEGSAAVNEVVHTMDSINAHARHIAEIIATIDGIAFQTNILALNAAVEAARAGEQGRGFAVVAAEVRTLAGRSAEAARQIRGLINTSLEQVQAGTDSVRTAGQTMERVVQAIANVQAVVIEISTASAEQAHGIELVNQAVSRMDQATQQNAALVEQASAGADSLRQQAASLVQEMAVFKTRTVA